MNTNEEMNKNTLTDEQIKEVYDTLAKENEADNEAMKAAMEETENTEYNEIEELPEFDQSEADEVVPENVVAEIVKSYGDIGIAEEDILDFASLIVKYKENKAYYEKNKIYDEAPKSVKELARKLAMANSSKQAKISSNTALKFLMDTMINDAEMEVLFAKTKKDIDDAVSEYDRDVQKAITEAYDDIFKDIDKIRKENPEAADKLLKIKDAMDDANSYQRIIDFIPQMNRKRFKKACVHFNDTVWNFNKKVNVTEVKIPSLSDLLPVLRKFIPDKPKSELTKFLAVVALYADTLEYDLQDNLANVAFMYKFIDKIYKYGYTPAMIEGVDECKTIFNGITEVIDLINT